VTILFHVRYITLVWVAVLAGSFLTLPAGSPLSWRSDVVQVKFYVVLQFGTFVFFMFITLCYFLPVSERGNLFP